MNLPKIAMRLSLAAAFLMLAGKFTAYLLTGSVAILSDAAESVVHMAATAIAAASLWYADQPADRTHPYGHGKIAYFSAGFEGALISVAAAVVIYSGIASLIEGPQLHRLGAGLAIIAGLALVNLALGLFLVYAGKTHNSIILLANGRHVLTDMWTSAAVVAGVAAVKFTGVLWLDPAVAIAAGAHILLSGVRLVRESVEGLMEQADPEHTGKLVECLRQAVERELITDFHQLRIRQIDKDIWIETHLLVPGRMSTEQAHRNATEVEESIRLLFTEYGVQITSHVEPDDHRKAHPSGHGKMADPLSPNGES